MNACELIAVSTFLCDWPDRILYSTLINRLKYEELGIDEDLILLWQPFEYYPGEYTAECIETLHHQLVKTFERTCLEIS